MNSKWVVCVILGLFLYLNYKYLNPRFESSLVPTGYNGAHVLSGASLQIKFSSLFTLQRKSCMIPICHEPYLSVIQKIAYNFVKMCWNSFNSRFSRKAKSNCEFCDPPFGFHCVRWCCEANFSVVHGFHQVQLYFFAVFVDCATFNFKIIGSAIQIHHWIDRSTAYCDVT